MHLATSTKCFKTAGMENMPLALVYLSPRRWTLKMSASLLRLKGRTHDFVGKQRPDCVDGRSTCSGWLSAHRWLWDDARVLCPANLCDAQLTIRYLWCVSFCLTVPQCLCISTDFRSEVLQIRHGGNKGVVIAYPDEDFEFLCNHENGLLDKRSVGSNIVLAFRESMLKYEGGPTMLEVNDHSSRPSHARLNETFILLLLTNGVSIDVGCMRKAFSSYLMQTLT